MYILPDKFNECIQTNFREYRYPVLTPTDFKVLYGETYLETKNVVLVIFRKQYKTDGSYRWIIDELPDELPGTFSVYADIVRPTLRRLKNDLGK